MTHKPDSFQDVDSSLQSNVQAMRELHPHLAWRYLGDDSCRKYLQSHPSLSSLAKCFDAEQTGMYRGDLCRTAVLYSEGGYYMDMDMELRVPVDQLVGNETTFFSALSSTNFIMNAIMAVRPSSPILNRTLEKMISWCREGMREIENVGTHLLLGGLQDFTKEKCGISDVAKRFTEEGSAAPAEISCGGESVRLVFEKPVDCTTLHACGGRIRTGLSSYALFTGYPLSNDTLVGWSRFAGCSHRGCKSTSSEASRSPVSDDTPKRPKSVHALTCSPIPLP